MAHDFLSVVDHKPGEPLGQGAKGAQLWGRVLLQSIWLSLLFSALLPLWVPYLILVGLYGWPPNVPHRAQIIKYLRRAWTENPPHPGLSTGQRVWLCLMVVRKVATLPFWGSAWLIDEALYGRKLDNVQIVAPLIEISAGRSGSTQIARYLEDDTSLSAPSLLQSVFPYLWMWKLAPYTIGLFLSKAKVHALFEQMLPPEFKERHEGDPFRTDTFEASLYMAHLNHLCFFFGPIFGNEEFSTSRITPENRVLWEEDFVRILGRTGQKHLLWSGGKRLFVKGHFLCAGPALARRFPDARFLTLIRSPEKRFQSAINYLRANPFDSTLGAPPWAWLAETTLRSESEYCRREKAWFSEDPRRCVVRFDDYVKDLQGTMEFIYRMCMFGPVPAHIPTEHPPRKREQYLLNRSLAEVGIDVAVLRAELSDYEAWCKAPVNG